MASKQKQWVTYSEAARLCRIRFDVISRLVEREQLEVRTSPSDLRKKFIDITVLRQLLRPEKREKTV